MPRVLKTAVAVPDPDTNLDVWFYAGQVPPEWAAELIVNPSAWQEDVPEPEPEPAVVAGNATTAGPPGKRAGKEAWLTYADSLGLEVDADATIKEIIAGIAADGHPTE